MKPEIIDVIVRGYGDPLPVKGEKFGDLAVTPRIKGDTHQKFVITHIETGFAVASTNSIRKARQAASDLAALSGWKGLKATSKKRIAKLAPLRREILDRHGI